METEMSNNVVINIWRNDVFPKGAGIILPRWQIIKDGTQAYFQRKTAFANGTVIPADTLLIFDKAVQEDNIVASATAIHGTWSISSGIHRGTLMSRDSDWSHGYETLADAKIAYAKQKKYYQSIGYQCWFAYAYPPGKDDKQKVQLDKSMPYR
jgi:hypothetical protein